MTDTLGGHTAGPWQVKGDLIPDCLTVIADVDCEIIEGIQHFSYAHIATCEDEFGEFTLDAVGNARLIAAAPDLLAALIGAVDILEDLLPVPGETDDKLVALVDRARDAIAKAEGRS